MVYDIDASMPKALIILYILIGNSLMQPLLSKQWISLVEHNRNVQHIVALTTLILSLAMLFDNLSNHKIILYSIICYTLFIFTTKMDIQFNLIIITLIIIIFFYERNINQNSKKVFDDKILTDIEKDKIVQNNKKNKLYFTLVLICLTILGTLMYSHKKEVQYGGGYSILNFLLN
jgi:hypothetical protein